MKSFNEYTVIQESRKVNTASVRAELANRPRKELTGADAVKKKKESDDAWERLMAHHENKKKQDQIKEDMPANCVGTGAETSLPPSVEPGVKKKKVPSFIGYMPTRKPQQ